MIKEANQKGFTLVELLLATALFSFILLFVTAGFVQVNRAYNKGITVKRMHETARYIADQFSRTIINASSSTNLVITSSPPDVANILCIPNDLIYQWHEGYIDYDVNDDFFSLASSSADGSCTPIGNTVAHSSLSNDESITDPLVAVKNIDVNYQPASNTYEIIIELATNKPDSFTNPQICEPDDPYCDFVTLRTVVGVRR